MVILGIGNRQDLLSKLGMSRRRVGREGDGEGKYEGSGRSSWGKGQRGRAKKEIFG